LQHSVEWHQQKAPLKETRISFLITVAVFMTAAFLFTVKPAAAEYRIQPAVTLSEEYNDNLFLTPQNPVQDYITRALPSIRFLYTAPLWDWNVAYAYDYRYYAHKSKIHDSTQTLSLTNHTTLVKDFFFIDIKDTYSRVSLDTTRDYTQQSLFLNQTDSNVASVTPYFNLHLSSRMSGTTGYEYRNVWYKDPTAIDKTEHSAFADISDEMSLRTFMTAHIRYTRAETRPLTYSKTDASAGPRYEYADGSTLWLNIGNTWFASEQQDKRGSQLFWDTGFSHKYRTYTLSFVAALTYIDDPTRIQRREDKYVGTFRKETDRFTLGLTAGMWEYRDILTKHLQNTRYSAGGTVSYRITPALQGTYSLSIDRNVDNVMRTFSMLYLDAVGLAYQLGENTTLSADYRFTHGYSPDPVNYGLNYDNNRVTVQLTKQF
jgi:hypothetical protein